MTTEIEQAMIQDMIEVIMENIDVNTTREITTTYLYSVSINDLTDIYNYVVR